MTSTYRILVTGSREWTDRDLLTRELDTALTRARRTGRTPVIIHGACPRGADAMTDHYALSHDMRPERHPADWANCAPGCNPAHQQHAQRTGKPYCPLAGKRRNITMVNAGADIVLAFIRDQSHGATHCAAYAEAAGITVKRWTA